MQVSAKRTDYICDWPNAERELRGNGRRQRYRRSYLMEGLVSNILEARRLRRSRAYLHDAHSAPPSRTWTAKSVTANKQQSIPANDDVIDLTISSSSDESGDFNECL